MEQRMREKQKDRIARTTGKTKKWNSLSMLKKNWVCYLFVLPMLLYVILFSYVPMRLGRIEAFQNLFRIISVRNSIVEHTGSQLIFADCRVPATDSVRTDFELCNQWKI